jgi:hypothetical protein
MVLAITPDQARTVIELSEGRPGVGGGHVGHTKERHVSISKLALAERMEEPDPLGRYHGKIFWRAAFLDIHSCADLLSRAVTALGGQGFVREFDRRADGALFPSAETETEPVLLGEFDCRDQRGRAKARHVKLFMQKFRGRPHNLHLITFYPYIPME